MHSRLRLWPWLCLRWTRCLRSSARCRLHAIWLRLRLRWSRLPALLWRRRSQHLLLLRMTHRRLLRLILPALLALRLGLLLRGGALLLL